MTATLLKPGGLSRSQHAPNLAHNAVWLPQHVCACEAKQPNTGGQEPILAAIVLHEAAAMGVAVVLNAQSLFAIEEIRASNEGAPFVPDRDLQLGPRHPVQHEQHSKTRLHRGFCF